MCRFARVAFVESAYRFRGRLGAILFVLAICTSAVIAPQRGLAEANSAEIEQRLSAIDVSVMSPFCPGRVLRDCPSSAAAELKGKIRQQLEEGKSDQEIMDQLVVIYGDGIHAVPSFYGFDLLAWVLPGVFLLLGLVIGCFWLRRTRIDPSDSVNATEPIDQDKLKLVESELRKW